MLPWDALATFHTVMEEGSFSGAARRLALSQPTVRRQIESLETALRQTLFSRSPAGLIPTDAAVRAAPVIAEMAAAARSFERLAANQLGSVSGRVRITASEVFASQILPMIVAELADLYQGLTIELDGSNDVDDLLQREADIAIRMTRPRQAGLVARKLGDVELGFFGSVRYLERHAAPETVSELIRDHRLVTEDRARLIQDGLAAAGLDLSGMRVALKTDDNVTQIEAVRKGVGIGICLSVLGQSDAGLVRILPELRATLEMWIVVHEDLRRHPPIRHVYEHLETALPALLAAGLRRDALDGQGD
jgi:DNA-binding transcriptional LysR family regulator